MKNLGQLNWYRNFVTNISTKIARISDKLKNVYKLQYNWSSEDKLCLIEIIKDIRRNISLSYPDCTPKFYLKWDVSNIGIGAILHQNDQIIGIYSSELKNSEKNYSTVEKELYVVIRSIEKFRSIIWGCHIVI